MFWVPSGKLILCMSELRDAIKGNHYAKVVKIVKGGHTITETYEEGKTPLLLACELGFFKIVKYLLANGSTLTETSNDGITALHYAVFYDHIKLAKYLLKKGADFSLKTFKYENTVILQASSLEMILYLQSKGANIHDKNKIGHTLLTRLGYSCKIDAIKYLLEQGISINEKTYHGDGIIHTSASGGNNKVLQWLVCEKNLSIHDPGQYGTPIRKSCKSSEK